MITYALGVLYVLLQMYVIQLIDLNTDLRARIDFNFGALYAYLLNLDTSISDRIFSICLLGLLLDECGRQFRYCSQAVQGLWSPCTPRS